jgi:hypothetical protein
MKYRYLLGIAGKNGIFNNTLNTPGAVWVRTPNIKRGFANPTLALLN